MGKSWLYNEYCKGQVKVADLPGQSLARPLQEGEHLRE